MSKPRPKRRKQPVALCLFLGLLLAVLVVGTVYAQSLLGKIRYVDPVTTPTLSQQELDAYLATQPADTGDLPTMSPEDVDLGDQADLILDAQTVNILLIGQDRLPGETRARSDAMILCSFDTASGQLTMTSFLRDLYVKIPGYRQNRLNAAYAAGGMALLDQTLTENFGVRIDGNVEVDFNQFSQIIDLLGGVRLELRQDEASWLNRDLGTSLTEGSQTLTGTEALAYARIRKLDADGDFSRTSRQRKVLTALIDAYKGTDLTTALSLLDQLLPLLTTDLTGQQIVKYAVQLLPMLATAQIETRHVPAPDTYSSVNINGMAVLVADMEANRALLAQP